MNAKQQRDGVFNRGRAISTLRLSDEARQAMLDQREREAGSFTGSNRRGAARYALACQPNIVVTICQPNRTLVRYAVVARDMSETGVGFMHGHFLHTGTECVVSMRTQQNKWVNMIGRVVRCHYVGGKVHEVGVAFKRPIRLDHFITFADEPDEASSKPVVRMSGRVLYVTHDVEDGRTFREAVAPLGLTSTMVKTVNEAALMIGGRSRYDLLAIDESVIENDGSSPLDVMQEHGCALPMVLVTEAELTPETLSRHAQEAGYQGVLRRPLVLEDATNVLLQYLPLADAA